MVSRLFQIIYILMDKPYVTAKELFEKLEVSKRTIYRDINKLSEVGIPVYASPGKGGGISLLSNYVLDKTVLTMEEKTKIMESIQALSSVAYEEETKALEKLQSFFGKETQDWIEVDFSNWDYSKEDVEIFQKTKYAILHHNYTNITYSGARQETTKRRIKPLKLCFKSQAWYLYAFCELRNDYRFFKLCRISDICLEDEHFEPEKVGQLMYTPYEEEVKTEKVTYRIKKEMAYRAYDELENLEELENGDLSGSIEVSDLEWFIGMVLSYGPYMEVLEPKKIREEVKKRILKMKEIY